MSSKYMVNRVILSRSAQKSLSNQTRRRGSLLSSSLIVNQGRCAYNNSAVCTSSFYAWTDSNFKSKNKFDDIKSRDICASFSSKSKEDESKEKAAETAPIEEEKLEFQAETRQLLDIVTHSLYTDKQVFLRELISNASDALEKLRHLQSANEGKILDASVPLEIRIETDEANGTLTISDTGVGMTKDDMVGNLGTIARSGSKAFVQQLAEIRKSAQQDSTGDAERGIIGKFGVGFYSAFMVGDKVEVRSKYSLASEEDEAKVWTSSGGNTFSLATLDPSIRQDRGTSIVIYLKDDLLEFVQEPRIEEIIKKYSNFVNFPIFLNGKRVNTIQAIWSVSPKQVSDEAYLEFYKFISTGRGEPLYRLHLRFDAPLDIKALLFVPSEHTEKFGMGRMSPGVSLYSRKVLIENKCPDILPDWMRFMKGVVDSEDLPVSISREKAQDTALIAKIRKALARRFLNFLSNKAKKEPDDFKNLFYPEYGYFIKEGVCADYDFQDQLSKLLYFETSKTLNKELSSFDEYIARSPPEQKDIYYLCTASRDVAFQSPYYEAFQKAGREVIFIYSAIDEFTLQHLDTYENRKIISIEKSDIDLGEKKDSDGDSKDDEKENEEKSSQSKDGSSLRLSENEITEFCSWFKSIFPNKVKNVKSTNRLSNSPAMITNHDSGAMRRMMKMVDPSDVQSQFGQEQESETNVEFNPEHEIIVRMFRMRHSDPLLSKVCAEQVYDNCLVAAGLMDDSRTMLGRLNDLLLVAIKSASTDNSTVTDAADVQKESIVEKELNIDDTDKVVEAEIVEPKETKSEDSSAGEKKSVFIEESLTKEEAEKERIYPEPNSHPLDEFSDEELESFMNMSEKELEQELRKEESKEEGAYKFTKEALEDEVLKRRQEVIDSSDRIENAKLGEIKGNWTRSTDLDSLIKEKEKEELKAKERAEARKKKSRK